MGFLIDTCIWIDVERGILSPADVSNYTKEDSVYISPITIAELTFGVENAQDKSIRQKREAALNRLKKKVFLLIDENTGDIFGRTVAAIFRTKNEKDFSDIPGLDLVVFG